MTKKLALIGSGIKSISHLTIEAQAYIKQADCVLHLVNEPIFESWLKKHTRYCESLEPLYFLHNKRIDSYREITNKIIKQLEVHDFVSVVIYGHPTIFAQPGLEAIKIAKEKNIETIIIPGISAEDCLFAELAVDPSQNGCFSIEAMNFLAFDTIFDKYCDIVIWQLGMIGNLGPIFKQDSQEGLKLIQEKLLKIHSDNHRAVLFEAALYPGVRSKIVEFPLALLIEQEINSLSTLYIPGLGERKVSQDIFSKLKLSI